MMNMTDVASVLGIIQSRSGLQARPTAWEVFSRRFYRNCMENHLFPRWVTAPLEKAEHHSNSARDQRDERARQKSLLQPYSAERNNAQPRIVQGILGILRKSLDQAVAEKLILSNRQQTAKPRKRYEKR